MVEAGTITGAMDSCTEHGPACLTFHSRYRDRHSAKQKLRFFGEDCPLLRTVPGAATGASAERFAPADDMMMAQPKLMRDVAPFRNNQERV
jgi:hypothetical protein